MQSKKNRPKNFPVRIYWYKEYMWPDYEKKNWRILTCYVNRNVTDVIYNK